VEEPPPTLKFARSELTAALAAMDLADALEIDESTRVVSAESNARLLARAFAPGWDEDPTLDATVPAIAKGLLLPIDRTKDDALAPLEPELPDLAAMGPSPKSTVPPKATFVNGELDELDLPLSLPSFAPPDPGAPNGDATDATSSAWSEDWASPSQLEEHVPPVRSGVRERITPEVAQAIVELREGGRPVARDRTSWLVLGIWAAVISLAAAIFFIFAKSPASRTTSVDVRATEHVR